MTTAIYTRLITTAEAALLAEVAIKAYNDHYLYLWYDEGEWYRKHSFSTAVFEAELADPNNRFYLIYQHKEPVGFLKLKIESPLPSEPDTQALELERIYLFKATTGKGLGKHLMELTMDVARANHKKIIWLKTMDSSTGPIAFYQKAGFEKCGSTRLDYIQMKEKYRGMLIMKKNLA